MQIGKFSCRFLSLSTHLSLSRRCYINNAIWRVCGSVLINARLLLPLRLELVEMHEKCAQIWAYTRKLRKLYLGHTGIVNSVHAARRSDPLVASASDDCTIKLWDTRRRGPIDDLKERNNTGLKKIEEKSSHQYNLINNISMKNKQLEILTHL